ncbi:MAG TPA: ATP-dependent 6-phosphofructokinase [bacterium]|nr:ATP-dependent 6-phosphofructokinase [bacterium]
MAPWDTEKLGEQTYPSPLHLSHRRGDLIANFIDDDARILVDHDWHRMQACCKSGDPPAYFEVAGPRSRLFFDPESVRAAIVTCGGLCPGLNDVIRALVMQLHYHYGVHEILGIRYGFHGMTITHGGTAIPLTPGVVENIHTEGGSFLGSSRGPQSPVEIVDFLQRRGINMLFTVGGDGTLRGAQAILKECQSRNYEASVIGIPKTIDNDILYIDRSFGFFTAVEKAAEVLGCAHVEARGARNGIGLVKLMGRYSGFITARATLASGFVNFVLIPEVPFQLEGSNGFLNHLKDRLKKRGHAVIAVSEGAGQDLISGSRPETDPSGNPKLKDIGVYLKNRISDCLEAEKIPFSVKYFDPSYIIRSTPANTEDNVYCTELAQNAVHAAFAGRTGIVVGSWHNQFVMIPLSLVTSGRKSVDPDGPEWLAVLQNTGQPNVMTDG